MAQGSGRRRRKQRRARPSGEAADVPRGYARSRAKDDAARASLEPLEPGQRPTAVTVGAIFAGVAMVANLIALVIGYDPDQQRNNVATLVGTVLLTSIAIGMWRARYWAVLGMQTLLLFTILLSSLALLTAVNIAAGIIAFALVAGSGTLFWFLIKAMARIQMPRPPGASD